MSELEDVKNELKKVVLKNFNCSEEDALTQKIYHYINFDYFIKSIEDQVFYFERSKEWKDSYENFLFNANFSFNDNTLSFKEKTDWIYAKCFSVKEESYAMWQTRKDNNTIKFEITVGDIFNILFQPDFIKHSDNRNLTFRIGIVDYKTKEEIITHYKNKLIHYQEFINNIAHELLDSLFIKRLEYDFEQELRVAILYENKSDESIKKLIFGYDSNLLKKSKIIFHPELDEKTYLERKHHLLELGFSDVSISDILKSQFLKIKITEK